MTIFVREIPESILLDFVTVVSRWYKHDIEMLELLILPFTDVRSSEILRLSS
jgi:hypothetical protein